MAEQNSYQDILRRSGFRQGATRYDNLGLVVGGEYNSSDITLADGEFSTFQFDSKGRLKTILDGATLNLGGDLNVDVAAFTDGTNPKDALVDENGYQYTHIAGESYGPGYYPAEDSSFTAADSPVTIDINSNLGRNASTGYLVCDGSGDILIELSEDGSTFGTQFTMKNGETLDLTGLDVDSIRITHSGTDSAYRLFAK